MRKIICNFFIIIYILSSQISYSQYPWLKSNFDSETIQTRCQPPEGFHRVLAAVVDYDIRGKKLEQCMDIILRFWAEYLFAQQRSDEIAFCLPVNFLLKWSDWKQGFRPHYQGIRMNLVKNHPPDSSRDCFEKYLWEIFYHSNTQTAYFNYPKVKFEDVQIGDFVIKRRRRGHSVLIVDLAVDSDGNRIALFGQGDTPARQFYLSEKRCIGMD